MNRFSISYVNLSAQWREERGDLLPIIEEVMTQGQYVGGEIIERFESEVAQLCETRYCVALNSGTDSLIYGLMALGVKPEDEVITPPNSFVASTAAIVHLNAKPVFVDVLPDQNIDPLQVEKAITPRTRAIMPVHLTGRVAAMTQLREIADRQKIPIIEDAAQSIGSRLNNRPSGSFGEVGCFSTHPLKNLNACGDGGFVTTNNREIANKVKLLRNHGLIDRDTVERFGYVSRMDTLQAAILKYRLNQLPKVIEKRRKNVQLYLSLLNQEKIFIPKEHEAEFNTYHTFVIQCDRRDELRNYLLNNGIETAIHYPVPIHLQPAATFLNHSKGDFPLTESQAERIITLPVHQYLSNEDICRIAETVNHFFVKP